MFLTVLQVAARLSARGKPVRRKQVYQWVNVGVKVRGPGRAGGGGGERIRLRCTRMPGGMVFLERDVDAFIERLNAAWATDQAPPARAPAPAPTRRAEVERVAGRTVGFARCAPSEIGTYPALDRGGSRGGVRGGRHAGRRAAAPVAGTH